ncbi:TolC family protein [Candidatus Nitronereus thalassa]|uniref:TolC family protein n=1 Tax=Candidatus Nitronereus thalassa TaxID=3020898 RepID=A0ABU3K4U7_9BACT|nr:TolC family protein [Candidatus Nitronereus thalassa]MDT7041427.1 TolC family protein [Candidatus Nitronereus thalassa]
MKKQRLLLLLGGWVLVSGCATVTVDEEFSQVSQEALSRTGETVAWEQTPEDVAWTQETVQQLLQDGLTREEAVRLALINNRQLQVQFEMLGMAKADLIQAGLYTNPRLGSLIRFPGGMPGAVINTESDVLFLVSDLWNVPLRRNLATVEVLRTTNLIVQEILEAAANARNAFDEVLLQQALYAFVMENVSLFEATLEQVQIRFESGLVNQLDIFLAQNVLYESQLELASVKAQLKRARAQLLGTLGLDPLLSEDVPIQGNLEDIPHRDISLDQAWTFAQDQRVDLALTRLQITQSQRLLSLQKAKIFGDVGLGGNYTRSLGKVDNPGLVIALEIPVLNQNQGGIARAEFQVRQAEKRMVATEFAAKLELKRLLAELNYHDTHVELFRKNMLVVQEQAENYVKQFYASMQFNSIYLIQARQRNLNARRGYLHALRQYRLTESALQVALGGEAEKKMANGSAFLIHH